MRTLIDSETGSTQNVTLSSALNIRGFETGYCYWFSQHNETRRVRQRRINSQNKKRWLQTSQHIGRFWTVCFGVIVRTIDRVDRVTDVPQEFASLPLNVQQDRTDFLDIDLASNFSFLFYGLFFTQCHRISLS